MRNTPAISVDMKEIVPDIFRIRIPSLSSFGKLNSYLIKGEKKSALIDVGTYEPIHKPLFDKALERAGVSWDEISILLTHAHADHLGGLEYLWKKDMLVYSGMYSLLQQKQRHQNRLNNFLPAFTAFKKKTPQVGSVSFREEAAALYAPHIEAPLQQVKDGDIIDFGRYCFEAIETPGHDFCEICFWEPQARLFFSGDHLIQSITPSIYVEAFDDELGNYFKSLNKVSAYDAKLILPGHGDEFHDMHAITEKISTHHAKRVELTYEVVDSGVEEFIAITYALLEKPHRISWEQRSIAAQWKAVCETIGYLNYLEKRKRIVRSSYEESFFFHTR